MCTVCESPPTSITRICTRFQSSSVKCFMSNLSFFRFLLHFLEINNISYHSAIHAKHVFNTEAHPLRMFDVLDELTKSKEGGEDTDKKTD